MVIGVDGNEANVENKVGVSVYTFELLKYFAKKADINCQFIVYLKDNPGKELPQPKPYFNYRVIPGNFLWSQIFLPISLYIKRQIDVFFSPAHYSPRFCPIPTVVTIHDLSYFYYPNEFLKKDLYQLKNWTKYSIKNASKIIAVSKTTKKDLMRFYQIPEEKIEVIYNGYRTVKSRHSVMLNSFQHLKEIPKQVRDDSRRKNYILYVGTIQPRKNLTTLIEALNLLLKEKPEYSLVIVGKKGWLYEKIFANVGNRHACSLQNKIIFTGYVNNRILISLYKNAAIFVLPSFYEGFGIPILEAMNFGCPVISSFTSSLPEIGADACLYFNPSSTKDLKNKMIQLLDNQQLRKELIKKGKKRVKLFSWEKCGRETLEVLKKTVFNKDSL
jgi:glycosyltransferase involved in cell wall biosynthesis